MNISFKKKFIYIATPKSGSTPIRQSLEPYSDINSESEEPPYSYHVTAKELKLHIEKLNHKWDDFFTFTVVRNSWEAQVSFWGYMKKKSMSKTHPHAMTFLNTVNTYKSFKNWIKNEGGLRPWGNWHRDEHGDNLLSYIGKFENLQTDFDIICDKIKIPRFQLPHDNKSKHKLYTDYYDDETRQIVAERYAEDIEYFGYKFGE